MKKKRLLWLQGINEKIEGFFQICKFRGLDGSHGVMIPIQNVIVGVLVAIIEWIITKDFNEAMVAIKDLKISIILIIIGNLLYITNHFLTENININDFVSGLLVGISIGVNLIGIVLSAKYVAKNK